MGDGKISKKTIFRMIQAGKIEPEEGLEILKHLNRNVTVKVQSEKKAEQDLQSGSDIQKHEVVELLKKIISDCTLVPYTQIHVDEPLESIGIDSIMIKSLNQDFQKYFHHVSATVLFECQTVGELADYFLENHKDELVMVLNKKPKDSSTTYSESKTEQSSVKMPEDERGMFEKIAIIGMEFS